MTEAANPLHPLGRASVRIIAAGIVLAFCYFAASILITLLLSILLAYFLDPFVGWLERVHVSRAMASLVLVLVMLAVATGVAWLTWDRLNHFAGDWPKYRGVIREVVINIEQKIERLEQRVREISPAEPAGRSVIRIEEDTSLRGLLLRGMDSLYVFLLMIGFVPFLVFFMLAGKRQVWHGTMQLFPPPERQRVKEALEDISAMLRSYVAGNLLVAAILAVASAAFFWALGLDYPVLTGIVSGLFNLVPYIGAVLAWVPPLVVGLAKLQSPGMFLLVAGVLSFLHLIAINVLMPALVGRKVHLNALAVTIALLFWGWMWGAMGLILAIPITATMKAVCDHVTGWQPIGRWLGA